MGITLLFGCMSNDGYLGMLNRYIIQAPSRALLKKKALNLGYAEAPHLTSGNNGTCTFIGLYDSYQVEGSLRTGGVLGCTSYWHRKTLAAAMHRVVTESQLIAALDGNRQAEKGTHYLFRAVYLLSSSGIATSRRRAIDAWLLVIPQNREELIAIAKVAAEKKQVKLRILKIVSDAARSDELQFCGFAEAREVFDPPIRVGGCFLSDVKHFKRLSHIRALIKKDGKAVLAKQ